MARAYTRRFAVPDEVGSGSMRAELDLGGTARDDRRSIGAAVLVN
jgi:hypothetical protein